VSDTEETLRTLSVELRLLEGTANTLQARMKFADAALRELREARETLEGVEKEKEGASFFVPIGGGSFIKAALLSADKVIVGIGAGVSVEKNIGEAKESLGSRITEFEKTRESIQQQLSQVIQRVEEDRSRFQELAAKLSEEERAQGVRKTQRGP